MAEEIQEVQQVEPQETEQDTPLKENAGCLGIGASVLFPIIGVVIYFCQKKEVNNPEAYLWGAFAGFAIGFVMRIVSGAI